MNGIYENSPKIIDSNKIIETINHLKEIFNRMKEKFIEVKTKQEMSKYKKEVKKILNLMEEIEESIDINPLFSDIELFDFMDIKEMTEYILKDPILFEENFNFLLELLKDYTNITILKLERGQGSNEISYEEEYKKFEYALNRKKEFFYTRIYEHLGIYDDLIDEVTNILWGDFD